MSKRKAIEPVEASSSPEPVSEKKHKKRKQDDAEEIEVDVNAPEPPSKKAKRAEKKKIKTKTKTPPAVSDTAKEVAKEYTKSKPSLPKGEIDNADPPTQDPTPAATGRSDYGIWIGNLPFTATKDSLRQFFQDQGKIAQNEIVRLHMPVPSDKASKAQNKGFAYMDFTSQNFLDQALALSEKLVGGRRVLIKNAKSFEGRPDKPKGGAEDAGGKAAAFGGKEPAKRVFVGNLSFDVTQEDLLEHFGQAGEVEDVHVATFEDSGKCKGYAWVRFKEVEAAEAAVRGWVYRKAESDSSDEEEDEDVKAMEGEDGPAKAKKRTKGKARRHKQHLNRIQGRELRCEFAEDPQTRYKKRFGKGTNTNAGPVIKRDRRDPANARPPFVPSGTAADGDEAAQGSKPPRQKLDKEQRRDERRKRHERYDARNVAPGAAHANAPRATAAIVAGAGKKMVFE